MEIIKQGAQATGETIRDNWITPRLIIDAVHMFYLGVWFDPCPVDPSFDGLKERWSDKTFINPPFSQYAQWAEHGVSQFKPLTDQQIWLCHHNHDSKWFKLLLQHSTAICLLEKRVKFLDPETKQPKATAIGKCQSLIYLGCDHKQFHRSFQHLGSVLYTGFASIYREI